MRKIKVKVDRITVSGEFKNWTLQEIYSKTGLTLRDGALYLERENADGELENLAFMAENNFQRDHWRLDFNPTNLNADETAILQNAIYQMTNAHFTRLDIAFDVLNFPLAMKYRVYRFNVREDTIRTIRGRNKNVETIYWGSRKSEQQIRLYNKLIEQKKKKLVVSEEISSWVRLELQLRGSKPAAWLRSADLMLEQFKLDNLQTLPPSDRATLHALIDKVVDWKEFNKQKQAKYRKMAKQAEGFETELADAMKEVLAENLDSLQSELKGYLRSFDIKQ